MAAETTTDSCADAGAAAVKDLVANPDKVTDASEFARAKAAAICFVQIMTSTGRKTAEDKQVKKATASCVVVAATPLSSCGLKH